ncbi:glycosyltransferase family 2 protein [Campylobacter sp. MG1]|uniref:glycosyltransferase family 2 protein n=1 Tax=Campylobacter sp. MG1 TaxID=2976332 RepID=UPI00226CA16D|nr:glycosyltransferase family 2 protein [Campylobacter sp. MG1]
MPLISIILPTYNVEKYITRALESCINQTLKDIEIIVVDDKGQDKSIDIAYEYANKDSRIKIIHNKENLKLLHARAEGVKVATSDLIMFLDPDDELELDACEIAYRAMVDGGGQNTIDMVIFNSKVIRKDGIYNLFNISTNKKYINIDEYRECFIDLKWNVWNKLYKKKYYLNAIDKINKTNYKGNMAEDALLTYFITYEYQNKILLLNEKLYKYYTNDISITNTTDFYKITENIQSFEKILKIIKQNNKDDFTKKYFYYINKEYIIYSLSFYRKYHFKNLFFFYKYLSFKINKKLLKLKLIIELIKK